MKKTKLKLIKYNKQIQNQIDINIINYRLLSKKYIIYETKEKGKEYDSYNHNLIYDGEYLNGKRNGKGKEYDRTTQQLIYEGEYLKGKRNGKAKEYYNYYNSSKGNIFSNGKAKEYYNSSKGHILKFEGEYFNNKIWNGKLYDKKNENFSEIKEGKGFIKEYNINNNLIFEGEYLNGERYKGKDYYDNGKLNFEREYFNGRR